MLTVSFALLKAEPHTTVDCEEMNSGIWVEGLGQGFGLSASVE
jgi:hypothetical protein